MNLIHPESLAETLNAVNDRLLFDEKLTRADRREVAHWLMGRQGQGRSYAQLPAPLPAEYERGAYLFTGEKVTSGAAVGHILGEEACRLLLLLDVKSEAIQATLKRATTSLLPLIEESEEFHNRVGFFCCGKCTVAMWRHIMAGGLNRGEERLEKGLTVLKGYRDEQGGWRRFPFYYTLLGLSEMDHPAAIAEMRYVAPVCHKKLKRLRQDNSFHRRRQRIIEQVLAKC